MTEHVTSRQNPLCRHVKKLQSNRAYRYEQRQFLADGLKLVEEALRWGCVNTLILREDVRMEVPEELRTVIVPQGVMKELSRMDTPQGAIAVCAVRDYADIEDMFRLAASRGEDPFLVICDEMGYVGFDKEGAELLFNIISTRTGTRATIITTNLPFTRWEEVIKDKVLCSALVDRLCHKAYMVNMTGQSYRVRETQKMLKNLE